MYIHLNQNLPSRIDCFPSGLCVQSSKFPLRLKSTASPTEERRLCNAPSGPRSFRLRILCELAIVAGVRLPTVGLRGGDEAPPPEAPLESDPRDVRLEGEAWDSKYCNQISLAICATYN